MIKINFSISSRYVVNRDKLRQTVERVLKNNRVDNAQLDISVVGKRKIKQLNETQLHHQGETDVLTFPQHERQQLNDFPSPKNELPHLGEIVINFPYAVESAKRYGKMVDDQLSFYLEHGLMHLMGYHHE